MITSRELDIIDRDNSEYDKWNDRGVNLQFRGNPSTIIPVDTIPKLEAALQFAVDRNKRLAVRGGGHCLEDFTANDAVEVLIDISQMKGIRFDAAMNCIEVCAGNTVGEMHEKLFHEWGILLPVGEHPNIGMGGHIQGGAFGFLCREFGLGADYLHAVEVIWFDRDRKLQKAIATAASNDQHHDLWWAHTGGGAGNFGIVTRLWFRDSQSTSTDPKKLLPTAPPTITTVEIEWKWSDLNRERFSEIVEIFCDWSYANVSSSGDGRYLFGTLYLNNRAAEVVKFKVVLTNPGGSAALDALIASVCVNPELQYREERTVMRWLDFCLHPFPDIFGEGKGGFTVKDSFMEKPFTRAQIDTIYNHLSDSDKPYGFVGMTSYGGKVNDVPANQTAAVQRSAILIGSCTGAWQEGEDMQQPIEWARQCYAELFHTTGGVPVPNGVSGGCIIAHPDKDLANPEFNKSGVPWYRFYYQGNYERLQKIKAKYDPLSIFRHSLSVEGADE